MSLVDTLAGAIPNSTGVSTIGQADGRFYKSTMAAVETKLRDCDNQIADIDREARKLYESKEKLESERERLLQQKNAARLAIRYLEDQE